MESHSSKKSLEKEYDDIIKQAKEQPGLEEVMKVYGQYEQLVIQSQEYLGMWQSAEIFSVSTSSS